MLIVALLLAFAVPTLAQTVAPKGDEAKLIAVLKSADASRKDKIDACRQLAIIGGKDSIAPLAALLGNEELSHNARYALEPNPDPAVDEALRDALGKVKGGPLVGVIGSVGVRRDAKAVGALARLLSDSDRGGRPGRGAGHGQDRHDRGRERPAAGAAQGLRREQARCLRRPVPLRRVAGGRRPEAASDRDLRPDCASSTLPTRFAAGRCAARSSPAARRA